MMNEGKMRKKTADWKNKEKEGVTESRKCKIRGHRRERGGENERGNNETEEKEEGGEG